MTDVDFLGHIGYIWILIGMLCLTMKKRIGWLLRLMGEALWVYLGVRLDLTSVWFWGTIFLVLDLIGYYRWRKHEKDE